MKIVIEINPPEQTNNSPMVAAALGMAIPLIPQVIERVRALFHGSNVCPECEKAELERNTKLREAMERTRKEFYDAERAARERTAEGQTDDA